jgi:hypothetical protein
LLTRIAIIDALGIAPAVGHPWWRISSGCLMDFLGVLGADWTMSSSITIDRIVRDAQRLGNRPI